MRRLPRSLDRLAANRGEGCAGCYSPSVKPEFRPKRWNGSWESEPTSGGGTIRDHIAAEMANQLLGALGQKSSQDPQKTKKLRELGAWRDYDRWPED